MQRPTVTHPNTQEDKPAPTGGHVHTWAQTSNTDTHKGTWAKSLTQTTPCTHTHTHPFVYRHTHTNSPLQLFRDTTTHTLTHTPAHLHTLMHHTLALTPSHTDTQAQHMHTQTLTTLTFRHVPHATVEVLRRQKQDPLEAPDSALSTQAASPVGSLTSICISATSFATSANRCAHLHEGAYMLNCMFVCVDVLTCMLNSIYLPPPTAALRGHIPPRPSKHQRHPSRALSGSPMVHSACHPSGILRAPPNRPLPREALTGILLRVSPVCSR